MVKLIVPGMKSETYGRIINIISTSVKQPLHGLGVSNTIRAAVANWSKTLATELAPFHITVNNVLPGATETDRLNAIISNKANKQGKSLDDIRGEMLAEIPMKTIWNSGGNCISGGVSRFTRCSVYHRNPDYSRRRKDRSSLSCEFRVPSFEL
jgi:NAD(P)-dependent dehydrogenase (short-subunit alcohol dehydrogenase family)